MFIIYDWNYCDLVNDWLVNKKYYEFRNWNVVNIESYCMWFEKI